MSTKFRFADTAAKAIADHKARSTNVGARRLTSLRMGAEDEYPAMDHMRDTARAIRLHTLSMLDLYLDRFAESLEATGGTINWAVDGAEANEIVTQIARDAGSTKAVKSKSMVTEEIHLNRALEAAGVEVVETDLGEFIVQLSGDTPSHINAPVLHKTRYEIGELFRDEIGAEYTDDPTELNAIARRHLRSIFLGADLGISGVNFAVADTGSIVTVTNEGNARLCTTAPDVHIAVMGMERIVPSMDHLAVMLEVLARSATGQRLSVYTNVMTGPRFVADGAEAGWRARPHPRTRWLDLESPGCRGRGWTEHRDLPSRQRHRSASGGARLMAERSAFLERVNRVSQIAQLPDAMTTPPAVTSPPLGDVDLLEHFTTQVTAADGVVHRVGEGQVAGLVAQLPGDYHATEALLWSDDQVPIDGLRDVVAGASVAVVDAEAPRAGHAAHNLGYMNVTIGITGAMAGLAESGSLVLTSGPGRSRMASLIPLVHIAVLPADAIYRSLTDFALARPDVVHEGANLLYITGPSRTGDIEMELNLGVHGPKHLHVLVIEQSE